MGEAMGSCGGRVAASGVAEGRMNLGWCDVEPAPAGPTRVGLWAVVPWAWEGGMEATCGRRE